MKSAFIMILFFISVCVFIHRMRGGMVVKRVARLLTSQGWILYYRRTCPHCVRQLAEFGSAASLLNKIDMSEVAASAAAGDESAKALAESVRGVPQWTQPSTGKIVTGFQTLGQIQRRMLLD